MDFEFWRTDAVDGEADRKIRKLLIKFHLIKNTFVTTVKTIILVLY